MHALTRLIFYTYVRNDHVGGKSQAAIDKIFVRHIHRHKYLFLKNHDVMEQSESQSEFQAKE